MTRIRQLPAALLALTAAACLDDTPLVPAPSPTEARLEIALEMAQSTGAVLDVRVYFLRPRPASQTPEQVSLLRERFPIASGGKQLPLGFDLRPCLLAAQAASGAAVCDVFVHLQLFSGNIRIDDQTLGPIRMALGGVATAPEVFLAAGTGAPQLAMVTGALKVDAGLVRYRIGASDPDGDILSVRAQVLDSSLAPAGESEVRLSPPRSSLDGALYALASDLAQMRDVSVKVLDTKGNQSAVLSGGISPVAAGGPRLGTVTGLVRGDSVDLSFSVTDPEGDGSGVEVVFRNVVAVGTQALDTLYSVCARAIPAGNGTKQVTCPKGRPFTNARVIVVPHDAAGNWGLGNRCHILLAATCGTQAGTP
ncbi:MAG: hypothetical protein ACREON_05385 [Gemmatimonadaceae bacterium]